MNLRQRQGHNPGTAAIWTQSVAKSYVYLLKGGGVVEWNKCKAEWFFQYNDGPFWGRFLTTMTPEGLEKFATLFMPCPLHILLYDSGGEVFRKRVGAIVQSGAVLRFRTTLSLTEGNGTHTWIGVFSDATEEQGAEFRLTS